ncbi:MAG: methionine--tRNA ligase [Deltaproteobacteria bacterium]|nr:methionine--tRNA ligase [Deltaproteobacteria bacterium]
MKKFYVTTAIDYVNNLPHLGTAYEKIAADAVARYRRMSGDAVHFQMGSDEHSANVKKEALRKGLTPKAYCDGMRDEFLKIWKSLGVSCDGFIQTSEKRHAVAVGQLFEAIFKKGDIYKSPYEGWYCESCEAFFTDKDLVDGKCPNHKSPPKWLKEENYFFRLSAYQKRLLKHYQKHPEFILPGIRRNEILRFVEGGLEDISVSRASFDWGIPLPIDKGHVVYVWFDALINYITAVGYGQKTPKGRAQFRKLWPADLHIIGKDITRFHCVIWPAMLMSAGLPLPKTVFGHGFVSLKGEKMSKTLGNIVTPLDIVPKYGADAIRYYLLRSSSFGSDGDFTWDDFIKRYNSDLANDLGNLLNRTLGMSHKYLEGEIRPVKSAQRELQEAVKKAAATLRLVMDYQKSGDLDFHQGLEAIWEVVHVADKRIDKSAPWLLAREGRRDEIRKVLYQLVDTLRNLALLIAPFLPRSSEEIWRQLGLSKKLKWENQRLKNIRWGKTPAVKVQTGRPIFPRIEPSPPAPLPSKGEGTGSQKKSTGGVIPGISEEALGVPLHGSRKEKRDESAGGRPPALEADGPPVPQERTEISLPATQMKGIKSMELDISEFQKLDLRVATVLEVEKVAGTDKLLRLQIDLGGERRQIVAGIAEHYTPEQLQGKSVVIVANLKPATIRGVESRGMLLAASNETTLSIVTLDRPILPGAKVK